MKKKLITLMLVPAITCFAGENISSEQLAKAAKEREEWTKQHFVEQGMPVPDGGVTVIPEAQMKDDKSARSIRNKIRQDVAKYGYFHQKNDPNLRLFNLKMMASRDFKKNVGSTNDEDTHLRKSISEIKMAYNFKEIPVNEVTEVVGFAPYLTYIKDKGWVGAGEFFTKEGVGNCVFTENNIKLSHGAVILPKEDTTYEINGKATSTLVTGTPRTQFIYEIEWYDNSYFRKVECSNKNFDASVTDSIIELAKVIDINSDKS